MPPSAPRVVAPFGGDSGAGVQEVVFRMDKFFGGGRGKEKRKMKVWSGVPEWVAMCVSGAGAL